MKKTLLLWFLLVLTCLTTSAESVSRNQAYQRALTFLSKQGISPSAGLADADVAVARRRQVRGADQTPAYYVFNVGDSQGFVVVAGDDRVGDVLAYSDHGAIDLDRLSGGLADWFDCCDAVVAAVREGGAEQTPVPKLARRVVAAGAAIEPFLKTTWDQDEPYNQNTPFVSMPKLKHSATGCVATAMAQVMAHYRYPAAVTAQIPAYTVGRRLVAGVAAGTAIDWDNMLYSYGPEATDVQRQAVANLMLYCGASVEMNYGQSSSAVIEKAADALKNYFGYSGTTTYRYRDNYTAAAWDELLYGELQAGRPVLLAGQTGPNVQTSEGHAFILHGYKDGYYYVNWGWGGRSDGYFLLTEMTPPIQGTGGSIGGFNYRQMATIGIQPDDGTFSETPVLTLTGTTLLTQQREFTIPEGHVQYGPISMSFTFGSKLNNTYDFFVNVGVFYNDERIDLLISGDGEHIGNIPPNGTGEMTAGCYLPNYDGTLHPGFDKPGTYRLVPMCRAKGESEWTVCDQAGQYCLVCVIDDDKKMTISIGAGNEPPVVEPVSEVTDEAREELAYAAANIRLKANGQEESFLLESQQLQTLLEKAQAAQADGQQISERLDQIAAGIKDERISEANRQVMEQNLQVCRSLIDYNDYISATVGVCQTNQTACREAEEQWRVFVSGVELVESEIQNVTTLSDFEELKFKVEALQSAYDQLPVASAVTAAREAAEQQLDVAVKVKDETLKGDYLPQIEANYKDLLDLIELQEAWNAVKEQVEQARTDMESLWQTCNEQLAQYDQVCQQLVTLQETLTQQAQRQDAALAKLASAELFDEQIPRLQQAGQDINDSISQQARTVARIAETLNQLMLVTADDYAALADVLNQVIANFNNVDSMDDLSVVTSQLTAVNETMATFVEVSRVAGQTLADQQAVIDAQQSSSRLTTSAISQFETDIDAAIDAAAAERESQATAVGSVGDGGREVVRCVDMNGRPANPRQKGIVILQFSDGTTKKVRNLK